MVIKCVRTIRAAIPGAIPLMVFLAGCGSGFVGPDPDTSSATRQSWNLSEDAGIVDVNANGITLISGELLNSDHVESWSLGPMAEGSRIIVDLAGYGENFSVGLFDHNQQVRIINHDRFGGKDPYLAFKANESIDDLYLAVASDPHAAASGPFTVTITHSDGMEYQESEVQKVVLRFSGGENVTIGNVNLGRVLPFDAADLDASWAGLTDEVKDIVMDSMVRIYEGLDVEFYFDDDPDLVSEHSTSVYFGAEDSKNVGLAASIDYGNRYKDQNAIVYTGNFAKYIPHGYSHEDLAQGFANVAAHELGHLLGLNHTDLADDVMNVSATVDALMAAQYFVENAGLDRAVFPVGKQDGAERIFATVGGVWSRVVSARDDSAARYAQATPNSDSNSTSQLAGIGLAQLSSAQHCTNK